MHIGVDLGGTKIEAIALDCKGHEHERRRIPTPRGSYQAIVDAVVGLVLELDASMGVEGTLGIGIPGSLSALTGRVKNANTTELIGEPLDQDLADRLQRPVRLANDANCFAVSEATDGAGAGAGVVFGVILGTGVGGGLVVNGQVLEGVNGIAGEWGHNPLPSPTHEEQPGPACYCGRLGCLETWISGPGLVADHRRRGGAQLGAADIVESARQGDELSRATLAAYQGRLARGLAGVINVVDPDVIVLGGGLSRVHALYEEVPRLLERHVFSDRIDTQLRPPKHGDSSGVRGAAWLWRQEAERGS